MDFKTNNNVSFNTKEIILMYTQLKGKKKTLKIQLLRIRLFLWNIIMCDTHACVCLRACVCVHVHESSNQYVNWEDKSVPVGMLTPVCYYIWKQEEGKIKVEEGNVYFSQT